ncbi:FkbM family methyltransferase [Maridesulfovibrio frigidus]|uniref:FkbM family methyltransferase n=1 Tax=Maridesulfovibrio frigidus TaxID=340956 RepID=UPI0004E21943|nr:FkbM family methyltransferase [Maridesulfovibrio frigidus]
MTREKILKALENHADTWMQIPSVFRDKSGAPEFEMVLAKSEMKDVGVSSLVFRETKTGGFEYASRAFLHAHLQPNDMFIDVGAHFGLYTLTAALKFPGKIKVLAIEPHPLNVSRLRMWTEFNECSASVTIVECAASDRSGHSLLRLDSSMGHSLLPRTNPVDKRAPIKVAIDTVDNIASKAGFTDYDGRIFLKIDTEGHELQTIKGAIELLKTGRVAAIIWEKGHFHITPEGMKEFVDIMNILRDLGYDSFRFPHEDMGGPLIPYVISHESCNIISLDSSIAPRPNYEKPWGAHCSMSSSMRPKAADEVTKAYTERLIAAKSTDCGRWSRWDHLHSESDIRAGLAGQFVPEHSKVLDAGAGMMLLRDYIPETCIYTPLDIVARSRKCIVADLNQHQYPDQKYDVIMGLFIIEFLHEPEEFLKWAYKSSNKLIFTYYPARPNSERDRRIAGLFNDLGHKEIAEMIELSGWKLLKMTGISAGQICYQCEKKD